MLDVYSLYFDGSCGPKNPGGTAAYGYTLSKFAEEIEKSSAVIGSGPEMSNNVAEYAGLYEGLSAFNRHYQGGNVFLNVRGDSRLVINQMSGKWRARSGLYYAYYEKAQDMAATLRWRGAKLMFEWIGREFNTECDALSKAHQETRDVR